MVWINSSKNLTFQDDGGDDANERHAEAATDPPPTTTFLEDLEYFAPVSGVNKIIFQANDMGNKIQKQVINISTQKIPQTH